MSSSPVLLSLFFGILRRMLNSKSYLMSIERNPMLSTFLKMTFYAQFCVGERKEEVVRNTDFARSVLSYDGILFEYALDVLGGEAPTAEETKKEIEVWSEWYVAERSNIVSYHTTSPPSNKPRSSKFPTSLEDDHDPSPA
ncbi:Nn.00g010180.m01.CDS01 [Neocucurbitaria sp. VM-36]